ncbi:MAG TPA: hypothetical protein VNS80_06395 [Pseudolysinimonas sp.]|nr:hypothetical protein [Pseudolysinimonas sp.]
MNIEKRTKKFVIAGVAAALVIGGGGAAFAYWTAQGSGTGTATAGVSTDFTITSVAPVGDPLVPGGSTQSVTFTVVNESTTPQTLTSVTVTVANADGTAWTAVPGCSAADYTIGTPSVVYGELDGGADVSGTVTIAMNNLGTDQDACQGVTVPLYLVAA